MRRILITAAAALALGGCALLPHRQASAQTGPYANPFYAKYLSPSNPLDQRIRQDVLALRENPRSATLHNDLGQLLWQKGFPKDAELEFERAVNADSHFYPGWYNLGLLRSARNDYAGARFAFARTIHYKPGHSAALFQMGLAEEMRGNDEAAIDYYAKAFLINHALLDVKVNPRIVDSQLVARALLKAYPKEHLREAQTFEPTPAGYGVPATLAAPPAASPQPAPGSIIVPAAPVTDPSQQTPAPTVVPVPPRPAVTVPPPAPIPPPPGS